MKVDLHDVPRLVWVFAGVQVIMAATAIVLLGVAALPGVAVGALLTFLVIRGSRWAWVLFLVSHLVNVLALFNHVLFSEKPMGAAAWGAAVGSLASACLLLAPSVRMWSYYVHVKGLGTGKEA
jgi:hypothetical protein